MYLCIYVSMYLFIYVSMYLCIFVSIYVYMYLCIYVSMYLCICVSICVSMCVSICVSIYLSIHVSIDQYACLSVFMSVCVSIYLLLYLFSVYLHGSTYLSVDRSIDRLIHGWISLSIYLYMCLSMPLWTGIPFPKSTDLLDFNYLEGANAPYGGADTWRVAPRSH